MSIEATTWALNVPIGGTPKVLLLGLANHAHPDGSNAFPAVETLTAYAHCDRRTVQRNLRKLQEDGWIAEDGVTPHGVTMYRLAIGRGGGNMPRVTSESGGGGTGAAGGAAPMPPEPSSNRQEPSSSSARAKTDQVPSDFPDELRPHANAVYAVLKEMAEHHGSKAVTARGVALVVMANRRKALVAEAYALASWAADKNEIKDVVGRYRTWMKRADEMAGVERLDEQGLPASPGPRRSAPVGGRVSGMDKTQQNLAEIRQLREAGEIT